MLGFQVCEALVKAAENPGSKAGSQPDFFLAPPEMDKIFLIMVHKIHIKISGFLLIFDFS